MAENKLNDIIGTSLDKIKALADGETVIGNPIATAGGVTVIPVSKVSMGFASGGLDYSGKKAGKGEDSAVAQNFGGGGGTGVTVTPVAFLIISPNGDVKLLPISGTSQPGAVDKVTSLIERSPDILAKIKKIFSSDKKKTAKNEETEEADLTEEAACLEEESQ